MAAGDQRHVAREHILARGGVRRACGWTRFFLKTAEDFKEGKISEFHIHLVESFFYPSFFSHFRRVDRI